MIGFLKPALRTRTRWVAAVLLVCIGFFHATVALSACMPMADSMGNTQPMSMHAQADGHESHAGAAEHGTMRVSDLLCKTHCDSENAQASHGAVSAPAHVGPSVLYVVPVLMRPTVLQSRRLGPDIVAFAAPDPVYLLSARIRV